jgi:hypothetical protein
MPSHFISFILFCFISFHFILIHSTFYLLPPTPTSYLLPPTSYLLLPSTLSIILPILLHLAPLLSLPSLHILLLVFRISYGKSITTLSPHKTITYSHSLIPFQATDLVLIVFNLLSLNTTLFLSTLVNLTLQYFDGSVEIIPSTIT